MRLGHLRRYFRIVAAIAGIVAVSTAAAAVTPSAFVGQSSSRELTEFLKAGRLPNDPQTVSGRPMPGFAYVAEADLTAISDYLKELHGSQ